MKVCRICGQEKAQAEFNKTNPRCRDCCTANVRRWREGNPEKSAEIGLRYKERTKSDPIVRSRYLERKRKWASAHPNQKIEWARNNPEKAMAIKERDRERQRKWRVTHSEESRAIVKRCYLVNKKKYYATQRRLERIKLDTDLSFRLTNGLRSRVRIALKGRSVKAAKTMELIGCTIDQLRRHLESQFDEHMTWDNYGSYWHVDHIRPCARFDLTKEEEQRMCFHWTNLQPLEARENMKKGTDFSEKA